VPHVNEQITDSVTQANTKVLGKVWLPAILVGLSFIAILTAFLLAI